MQATRRREGRHQKSPFTSLICEWKFWILVAKEMLFKVENWHVDLSHFGLSEAG